MHIATTMGNKRNYKNIGVYTHISSVRTHTFLSTLVLAALQIYDSENPLSLVIVLATRFACSD